jgi:5-methyltetrahydrofolate--homocysteine methyltransferase
MSTYDDIREALISGQIQVVVDKVQQLLNEGMSADSILNQALIPGMTAVGDLYECGEVFVPEMLVAARAMDRAMHLLKPLLVAENVKPFGKVAIATVKGDLHDIGKKLVGMMLEGGGFEVDDLGIDTPPGKFVQAVRDGAQVVAVSALLTTTMTNMKSVVDAIREAGLRDRTKIIIGGAPVTAAFAEQIGADGYAPDAASAVKLVRRLLGL